MMGGGGTILWLKALKEHAAVREEKCWWWATVYPNKHVMTRLDQRGQGADKQDIDAD